MHGNNTKANYNQISENELWRKNFKNGGEEWRDAQKEKKKVRLTLGFSSEIMQAGDIGMTSL